MRFASIALCLVLLALGAFWLTRPESSNSRHDEPRVEITSRSSGAASWRLTSNETIAISADDLEGPAVVVLDLALAEPSSDDAPLSGRILSLDPARKDREQAISGRIVDESKETARIEIPVAWLREGSYLIEIKTTEKSHFPLRRYKIEVR